MKPITALLLLSLASVGAACSDTVAASAADTAAAEALVETAEVQGTLNLNIGRANDAPSGLNLNAGASSNAGGLIVGPGASGGNFEDVGGLDIDLQDSPDTLLDPKAPAAKSDEDEIVRLKPEN